MAGTTQQGPKTSKLYERVHADAFIRVRETGYPSPDAVTLCGFYEIQFGKYRGQTFHWLLENALGYAAWMVGAIKGEGGSTPATALGNNKKQLRVWSHAEKLVFTIHAMTFSTVNIYDMIFFLFIADLYGEFRPWP